MSIKNRYVAACFAIAFAVAGPTYGTTVAVSFTRLSGSVSTGTVIFRADLSSLPFDAISSVTLIDSNSMMGGSPGAYSGFDLDAIRLSSTFATTGAQASAASGLTVFDFTPAGTAFTPGTQRPPVAARLNGTDASGQYIDPAFATLNLFDAVAFGRGSVSLGDGGRVTFALTRPTASAGLYLYVGEVSGDVGENISGSVFVTSVPEPTHSVLLLAGLIALRFAPYKVLRR